jgi:hypothetical protein
LRAVQIPPIPTPLTHAHARTHTHTHTHTHTQLRPEHDIVAPGQCWLQRKETASCHVPRGRVRSCGCTLAGQSESLGPARGVRVVSTLASLLTHPLPHISSHQPASSHLLTPHPRPALDARVASAHSACALPLAPSLISFHPTRLLHTHTHTHTHARFFLNSHHPLSSLSRRPPQSHHPPQVRQQSVPCIGSFALLP